MKKDRLIPTLVLLTGLLAAAPFIQAQTGHDGMSGMSHEQAASPEGVADMFLVKKAVDDYAVTFHVMEAQEGMAHGGSHNLMVKVEQQGRVLDDIKINSKVIHPDGQSESKMLMRMGDWYVAGYDLGHPGQHQLMVLFKTADNAKHATGVYYPQTD